MFVFSEISDSNLTDVKHFLSRNFKRPYLFWEKSILNFQDYILFSKQENYGYCYYLNDEIIASIFLIYDPYNDGYSLSSMYVDKHHRSKTLTFTKKVFSEIGENLILDFTPTDTAQKLFSFFKLKNSFDYLYIKIPSKPSKVNFRTLNIYESEEACKLRKIFYTHNMRAISCSVNGKENIFVYKDISVTKNNLFRNLSFLIYADSWNDKIINNLSWHCLTKGKVHIDFIKDNNYKFKLRRFKVLSNKELPQLHGNCELGIFNF